MAHIPMMCGQRVIIEKKASGPAAGLFRMPGGNFEERNSVL